MMVGGDGGGGGGVGGSRMDVVYVTERIISLAFPPSLDDATYTLHLREVAHMLSSKHGDNFKVSRTGDYRWDGGVEGDGMRV